MLMPDICNRAHMRLVMRVESRRRIAVAANEVAAARRRSRRLLERRQQLQCRIRGIDHLLEVLEARNMDGMRDIDDEIRAELDRLPRLVGVPLPCHVKLARNTRRLHAALLDWQQEVLDALLPVRAQYASLDAILEVDEAPREPRH